VRNDPRLAGVNFVVEATRNFSNAASFIAIKNEVHRGANMRIMDGIEYDLEEEEREVLRDLIETGQITQVSEDMRLFVEQEMPDLVSKLPPRKTN